MNRREVIVAAAATAMLPVKLVAAPASRRCEAVELRQYTLHAHRRDDLISLFDREFIRPQEALGIRVLGQFRDLDDPDRFVWMRGFETMESRATQLTSFYHGDVWRAHRDEANATMLDSDNVLLLRPAGGFFDPYARHGGAQRRIVVGIHYLGQVNQAAFASFFGSMMRPAIEKAGGSIIGEFVSAVGPNNFPGLPIREMEKVFIWVAPVGDAESMQVFFSKLRAHDGWRDTAPAECLPAFMRKPEILRLEPTKQSNF